MDHVMNDDQIEEYRLLAKNSIGVDFDDIDLLVTALTHRSYVNEHREKRLEHNERLEFLGDAILEMVVSDYLFRNFDEPEGIMTAWRSAMVRTDTIANAGIRLGYEPLVRLSKGEKRDSSRAHESILADCFEATIAAIYIDKGYMVARKFIYDNILSHMTEIIHDDTWRDPKSYLQELAQKYDETTPQYRTMKEDGPDHAKSFTVGLYIGGQQRAICTGPSKQEAQTKAAKEGIRYYKNLVAQGLLPDEAGFIAPDKASGSDKLD